MSERLRLSLTTQPPQRPLRWSPLVRRLIDSTPDTSTLYLVGGLVRDALLGLPGHDIDLATVDSGLTTARHLADRLEGAYYPLDPERQVGRIILTRSGERSVIDVATLRGDLLSDLRARDFTINAMAVRANQLDRVIDPLGGQTDLFQHKLLRQCAPASIADDPVRALRAMRLALQFDLHLEAETRTSARAAAALLLNNARELHQPERVRDEFMKILSLSRPASALRALHTLNLLRPLCPGELLEDRIETCLALVGSLKNILDALAPTRDDNTAADLTLGLVVVTLDRYRRHLQEHFSQTFGDGRPRTAVLLLTALEDLTEASEAMWAVRLMLSNAEKNYLDSLKRVELRLFSEDQPLDDREIFRFFRSCGETGIDAVIMHLARYLADHQPYPDSAEWGRLLEGFAAPLIDAFFRRHQQVIAPPPLLTGDDLIRELGLTPGRRVGELLDQLLEAQAAGDIATRKQALHLAKRLLDEGEAI